MSNTPFRFLDSPAALGLLRQALEEIGLSEYEVTPKNLAEANPGSVACFRYSCPWLNGPVELHWQYSWWPDGMASELDRVIVLYQGAVRGEINVAALLHQRLPQPLAERVVDEIAACCAELTDKRRRRVRGGS
jgi:hypothetical protein